MNTLPRCFAAGEDAQGELPTYDAHPELAIAALLYLMSSFPNRRSPQVARAVALHLRTVAADTRVERSLRNCARQLVQKWEAFEMLGAEAAGTGRPQMLC